jgi:hypothetical protein
MEDAAKFKDKLEVKQRAVRKFKEKEKIEHHPAYFEKWKNPYDKQEYWKYNHKYFEKDKV